VKAMAQTFLFAELDRDTREYLIEVREKKAKRMPGVYAETANPWPIIAVICGPIVIIATLVVTLTDMIDVIYDEPNRVAFLQTAGLMLGGWMTAAAIRSWVRGKNSVNGSWVYVDSVNVYEVKGEQVTISPAYDLRRVNFTHKYNNETYTNTVVILKFAKKVKRTVYIVGEEKAEKFVAFINYLVFAYGPDGEGRDQLPPETLGALARYVAKNDEEPLDENGKPDLNRIKIEYDQTIPEEPERVRRAPPNIIPYVCLGVGAVLCYFVMRLIDVPLRDDAIYSAVSQNPVEPRYLRAYLIDSRNTGHRKQVAELLATFYDPVINTLRNQEPKTNLKKGLADVLESVRMADQAVVSIRVAEQKSPPGGSADDRTKRIREEVAKRIANALTPMSRGIVIPPDVTITPPPPPVGEQLLVFVAMPSDAAAPHFDIQYAFHPDGKDSYKITARVEVRVNIDERPVATSEIELLGNYTATQADAAVNALITQIVTDMTNAQAMAGQPVGGAGGPNPGMFPPILQP